MAARRKVRVVAALLPHPEDPRRYLVQQRSANGARPSLWEFPGGKVEAGESDAEALVRECREELDVDVQVGSCVGSSLFDYPDLTVALCLYDVRLVRGEPKPLQAQAIDFLSVTGMRTVAFCEADLPLIELLVTRDRTNVPTPSRGGTVA